MKIKTWLALVLAAAMVLSMAACAQSGGGTTDETGETFQTEPSGTESEIPGTTAGTEPEQTEPPTTAPSVTEPPVTEPAETEPPVTEPPATEPEQEEVSLHIWAPEEDVAEGGWMEQMMARFEAMHPQYRIDWKVEAQSTSMAGVYARKSPKSAADVYLFSNDEIENIKSLERLEAVYEAQVRNDNYPLMTEMVTRTNGVIYGFPIELSTFFLYYNRNIYTEEDVKSFDTMLAKGPVSYPLSTAWYNASFFLANGCTAYGENGKDPDAGVQFGGQKGYEATEKMIHISDHPNFVDDASGWGITGLKNGTIAAAFTGPWDYPYILAEMGDALGIAPPPMIEIGGKQVRMKAFSSATCVGVNGYADRKELAMEFAALLATKESQKIRFQTTGAVPIAMGLDSDAVLAQDALTRTIYDCIRNTCVAQPVILEMTFFWDPMGIFGSDITNGDLNLENYKKRVDQTFD